MGEGWSDFVGLVLTTDPLDTAATARGIGTYVSYQPGTGNIKFLAASAASV